MGPLGPLRALPYMAPEQIRGEIVDARADIYALGGLLYEMLSGQRANPGLTQAELLAVLLDTGVMPLESQDADIPMHMCRLVNECLALDPSKRPGDVETVGRRLLQDAVPMEGHDDALVNALPMVSTQIMSSRETASDAVFDRPESSSKKGTQWALGTAVLAIVIGLLLWSLNTPKQRVIDQAGKQPTLTADTGVRETPSAVKGIPDATAEKNIPDGSNSDEKGTRRIPRVPQFKWRSTVDGGWALEGPNGAHIFAGLLINLMYGAIDDRERRWSRLPEAVRNQFTDTFSAARPADTVQRLVLSAEDIRTLASAAPQKLNLPRLGKVWVSRNRTTFFEIVNCRSLREGDSLVSARWTIRGYDKGTCGVQGCGLALARILNKSTMVGEGIRLNITVNRSESNSETPNRRHITCRIGF